MSALADRSLSRRLGRECGLRPAAQVVDFHQAQDHVDQRDQPEAERRVDPPGDLLCRAQHPADVEVLHPQAGDRNVAALEPGDRCVVERLIAARVGNQRSADPAEAPDDERSEGQHEGDRDRHRDREREERGHPPLHPVLHRPDERDDEKTERQRSEDDVGLIGDERYRRRGDKGDPDVDSRLSRHERESLDGPDVRPGRFVPEARGRVQRIPPPLGGFRAPAGRTPAARRAPLILLARGSMVVAPGLRRDSQAKGDRVERRRKVDYGLFSARSPTGFLSTRRNG